MTPKTTAAMLALAFCAVSSTARAQLRGPDTFYTNGQKIDAYTRDPEKQLRFTFCFAQKDPDDLIYRQEIVIVYDTEPGKAYYFDQKTRTFRGRWDFRAEKYSLLPEKFQLPKKEDITDEMFPPPGDLPAIGDLLRDPGEEQPDDRRKLIEPPPTTEFPDLDASSWESNYIAPGWNRVHSRIQFNGRDGTYQLVDSGEVGTLSDVRYDSLASGAFVISGKWSLKDNTGTFRFQIAPNNLNTFEGQCRFEGQVAGTWDGVRKRK